MPEWTNGPVLKTGDSFYGSEGSNPSPAARQRFVLCYSLIREKGYVVWSCVVMLIV